MKNRILKYIAVYIPSNHGGFGNSRKSGGPLSAKHLKSDPHNGKWSPAQIQKYIKQYEIEIKEIEEQLKNDSNNQELIELLNGKRKRKEQFEQELNDIPDYSALMNDDKEKKSTSRLTHNNLQQDNELKQIENIKQKLIVYIQKIQNKSDLYESMKTKKYNIRDKSSLRIFINISLKESLEEFCRNYLYDLHVNRSVFNSIMNDCGELIENNINLNELANNYIKKYVIPIFDMNELCEFLDTHHLLDSIKQRAINNSINGRFNKKEFISTMWQDISNEWNDTQLGILQYNKEHDKIIIPINFSNQELKKIVLYIINKNNFIEHIKNLRKRKKQANFIISHLDDIKKIKLNIGDTVQMNEQFFFATQQQGKPILYYNGNFLESEERGNIRKVHRQLMEEYYNNINLHKHDIIEKKSIQDWQKVDEISRFLDFDQIGMILYENIIIVLYHSDELSLSQVLTIIKSKFNNLIFYSQPEKGKLTRIANKINNRLILLQK